MNIKQNYDWLRDFHGCDGGDIGSPEKPSVWVCGIEWGGGHTVENLRQSRTRATRSSVLETGRNALPILTTSASANCCAP